jgi:hypothetical protein
LLLLPLQRPSVLLLLLLAPGSLQSGRVSQSPVAQHLALAPDAPSLQVQHDDTAGRSEQQEQHANTSISRHARY